MNFRVGLYPQFVVLNGQSCGVINIRHIWIFYEFLLREKYEKLFPFRFGGGNFWEREIIFRKVHIRSKSHKRMIFADIQGDNFFQVNFMVNLLSCQISNNSFYIIWPKDQPAHRKKTSTSNFLTEIKFLFVFSSFFLQVWGLPF